MSAIDSPALGRLWDLVAERLQSNGLRASGTLGLSGLDRAERHALAGLLGRPVATDRVRVDLAQLDRRLRAGSAAIGLVVAIERLRGPLVDRPARRQARAAATARLWAAGHDALEAAGLGAAPWVEAWFDDLRRSGGLARVPPERAEWALRRAVRTIAALPSVSGGPPRGRGELASLVSGDAHGLDDAGLLGTLVLRAAALVNATPYPASAAGRRALWRAVGVLTDEVSTTVLTTGLRSSGAPHDRWLDDRSAAGWETHLSLRDLRRTEVRPPPDGAVGVCENPRVLEAAIEGGSRRALVCTQGQPAVVVTTVLAQLVAAGAELRYHGDFDWPGIAIANLVVSTYRCRTWRFGANDYTDALAHAASVVDELPALGTARVESRWDRALSVAMARSGRAIHEELVLDVLLADLV